MATLLEKTRKINRLLQRAESVEYDSISRVLSAVINANVYIVNKAGKIFGHAFIDDFECDLMLAHVVEQGNFPKRYVSWLLKMDETSPNLKSKTGICAFTEDTDCRFEGKKTTIVPIYGVGDRIGTLIIAKYDQDFTEADLILAEYGATVVGMEMLRDRTQQIEIEARKKATVQIALATLSFSEVKAAKSTSRCSILTCSKNFSGWKTDGLGGQRYAQTYFCPFFLVYCRTILQSLKKTEK